MSLTGRLDCPFLEKVNCGSTAFWVQYTVSLRSRYLLLAAL
jgi:hypothetical protein